MSNPWNFTIKDYSPYLNYSPYAEGDPRSGWQALYPLIPNIELRCANPPKGDASEHITSLFGASITLEFNGTAIYLYGGGNSPYQVSLDNDTIQMTPLQSSDNLLYSKTNLAQGLHTLNLTALPSGDQQMVFKWLDITDSQPVGAIGPPIRMVCESWNTTIHLVGMWTPSPSDADFLDRPGTLSTSGSGASAALNFTGGIAVAINGEKNCGNGLYTVNLLDSSQRLVHTSHLNSSAYWHVQEALLFYHSGLDPNETYRIQLVNSGNDVTSIALTDFTIYQLFSPDDTSSGNDEMYHYSTNIGTIVGPTVAGVIVLVLLMSFILLRRRKRQRKAALACTIAPYKSSIITPNAIGPVYLQEKQQLTQALDNQVHNQMAQYETVHRYTIAHPGEPPSNLETQAQIGVGIDADVDTQAHSNHTATQPPSIPLPSS
ncbi:hypothetical protein BXZ70DRAFT_213757 [Cristinia sonorae]|uniref:Uncharacterized protein n=1 Tax=Cristinia sonorae TaxID=1940300 RepID=A0A8K0UMY7_9AGAR|nr:hypothetical protein BXZ70DRAFT_213757 [Cristinia sonorae]